MAFIKGFRAVDGLLTGEMFDFTVQDVSSLDWRVGPGWDDPNLGTCEIGSGYSGGTHGSAMGGAKMEPWTYNLNGWSQSDERLLAVFDVVDADYYKSELRLGIRGVFSTNTGTVLNGNVGVYPYIRKYTDPVTYTDTYIGGGWGVQLHRDDGTGLYLLQCHAVLANVIYNNHHYVLIGTCAAHDVNLTIEYLEGFVYVDYNTFFTTYLHGEIPEEEYDPGFGPGSEEGGYGPDGPTPSGGSGGPAPTFDDTSDPWVPSGMPPGISQLGFLNIYKCDASSLVNLGQDLFPEITWPTSLSDVGEVLAAFSDSIWNSKLIDFVISIHMIPVDVPAGNLEDIKLGARTMTGILARKVSADYVEVDCGTLKVDEYYTAAADYMTRCRLFLPFYGYIEIKPEYWQSAAINVIYRFNVVDGSFVARVTSTVNRHQKTFTAMIGQYSGSACIHLPASGASYASIFSGMVASAGGAAVGLSTGNVGVAATSIMNAAGQSGGEMNYSNPYNASASIMGHRKPFLLIERPVSHFATRYATEKGIPLLVTKTIGSCHGFTQAEDIQLDGIPCTQAEKDKIRAFFKSGVVIK